MRREIVTNDVVFFSLLLRSRHLRVLVSLSCERGVSRRSGRHSRRWQQTAGFGHLMEFFHPFFPVLHFRCLSFFVPPMSFLRQFAETPHWN